MTHNKKAILILGAVVVLALLYMFIFIPRGTDRVQNGTTATSTTESDIEIVTVGNIQIEVPEGVTIEKIPIEEVEITELPELNRPIAIPDFFPPDAAKNVATKISEAIVAVEIDTTSFDNWLRLANLRQQIEDYSGAEEIYIYLNIINPENDIAYLNLGNLYQLHLQEFEKAEANLRKGIENNITNVHAYLSLHELYRYLYKTDTDLAENILLEGIDIVDNDIINALKNFNVQ